MPNARTALLIHCSQEEAERIREAARKERRTISGFVLNAALWRLDVETRVAARREAKRQAELDDGTVDRTLAAQPRTEH